MGGRAGALAPGYPADAVVLRASSYAEIPYRFGVNLVSAVVKRGRVVHRDVRDRQRSL